MLLSAFIRESVRSLGQLYPEREAEALVLRLCKARLGVESFTHIIEPSRELPEPNGLEDDMRRLRGGEPLQYVLGWCDFSGFRFHVAPGVLIPRPETEEMTGLACTWLRESGLPGRVLDLCTGSGCIAWSIAALVPGVRVLGVDISAQALEIASAQGIECRQTPQFLQSDVLSDSFSVGGKFDLVVSNPPYIRESEKTAMHRNVLEHEPALALFVPDNDPLVFYRAIARISFRVLRDGGAGFVEINEDLGRETADAFISEGFRKVDILRDFLGKNRFVFFQKQHPAGV